MGKTSPPMLGDRLQSNQFQLVKLFDEYTIYRFDRDQNKYYIDLYSCLDRVKDAAILDYLSSFTRQQLQFEEVLPKTYYYDRLWTNPQGILSIEKFHKHGTESDLNAYLGPLAAIATSWTGMADFVLRFKRDELRFQSYAQQKIFSWRRLYWAYFSIYLSTAGESSNFLILIASDPMNHCNNNGLYLLLPRVQAGAD